MPRTLWRIPPLLFAALALLLTAAPAGAQAPRAYVNLNSYRCPPGYDRVSDCAKIGDVVVRVSVDGEAVADVTTVADSGVEVEVPIGGYVAVEVVGGAPAGGVLEDAALAFTAVEGQNAVTLIFVVQEDGEPIDLDRDDDGLMDEEELELGTDPNTFDTDGDGLSDGAEVLEHGTVPLMPDSDGDSHDDGAEVLQYGTDPNDPSSKPESEGNATVDFAVRLCPPGYHGKDNFLVCDEAVTGAQIRVAAVGADFVATPTTDANGDALVALPGVGEFDATLGVGGGLVEFEASCGVERGVDLIPIAGSASGTIRFPVQLAGDVVHCEWFVIPPGDDPTEPDGSLLVTAYLCPEEYSGNNHAADCGPLADVAVTVTGAATGVLDTTDAGGRVVFAPLAGGEYAVALGVPGDTADFVTFCGQVGALEPREVENPDTNRVGITLHPGEDFYCTFYVSPKATGAEPTPTQPAKPVTGLPNTGAGAAEGEKETSESATLALILAGSLGVASAVAVGANRKRRA